MNPVRLFSLVIMFSLFSISLTALETGDEIPGFSVVSGTGQILIKDDLSERTTVLFYEDRSQLTLNEELKEYLKTLSLDKDRIQTVTVVNCSNVGLLKKIWEERLIDHSRRTGMPVYGDWNGNMQKRLNYQDESGGILVINETGTIVYTMTGPVASSEFSRIGSLLQ
ncbi:MAG: YtfJ family protein [Spirochaetales bacterium]|nr:YtfJ family protein [Spirochaetales bacterium]